MSASTLPFWISLHNSQSIPALGIHMWKYIASSFDKSYCLKCFGSQGLPHRID